MKLQIILQVIETSDYILAVSDKQPVNGDICLDGLEIYSPYEDGDIAVDNFQKIIGYHPKGNAPELELPLLPEIVVEDDVEKLAIKCGKEYQHLDGDVLLDHPEYYSGFFDGFNYKSTTKLYSEDDLRKAMKLVHKKFYGRAYDLKEEEEIIQSLKQPKTPKWFVAKTEPKDDFEAETGNCSVLKTTTANGKTYLIGEFIYTDNNGEFISNTNG